MMLLTGLVIFGIVVYAFGLHIVCVQDRLLKRYPSSTPARRAWQSDCVRFTIIMTVFLLMVLLSYACGYEQWRNGDSYVWHLELATSFVVGTLIEKKFSLRA